jgi:hypothetical protein
MLNAWTFPDVHSKYYTPQMPLFITTGPSNSIKLWSTSRNFYILLDIRRDTFPLLCA